ncbi:MAG TPA: PAS domain S-box protein, partial [Bryobacteraceae bacterium]
MSPRAIALDLVTEQKAFLDQVFARLPDAIVLIDADDRILSVNPEFTKIFGYAGEESFGRLLNDLIVPEELLVEEENLTSRARRGESVDVETVRKRKDGARLPVSMVGGPASIAGSRTVRYVIYRGIEDPTGDQDVAGLLTITDSLPIGISVLAPDGKTLNVNRLAPDRIGVAQEEVNDKGHLGQGCHPDDLDRILGERLTGLSKADSFQMEMRLLQTNGEYRWHLSQYNPFKDESGGIIRWYVTTIDSDDRKRAEQALQRTQFYLKEGQRLAHMGSWAFNAAGFNYWSPELFQVYGLDPAVKPPTVEEYLNLVHPADREFMQQGIQKMLADHLGFDFKKRIVRPDGQTRHIRCVGLPVGDGATFEGFVGTGMDITEQEQLLQKLQQSEHDLRTITDTIRQPIVVLAPDGTTLYANRVALQNSGLTTGEVNEGFLVRACHSDDFERMLGERNAGLSSGIPFDSEARLLRKNGQYRWQLLQYNPLKDEFGQIMRWYVTATDINDQKQTEERLRNENLILREEIDRSSMFEEIVGSSKPMRQLAKQVEKVAPSDSTVLILGETGTGKELFARAVHRRSRRATRAFVRVNCAAIPQSLIASEL